jgi:hypothetical protein
MVAQSCLEAFQDALRWKKRKAESSRRALVLLRDFWVFSDVFFAKKKENRPKRSKGLFWEELGRSQSADRREEGTGDCASSHSSGGEGDERGERRVVVC